MPSKVVLFKGACRYGAANRYIDGLADGLRARGREVAILHEAEPDFPERLARELLPGCELVAGFDGSGMLISGPDPFIHNGIPRLSLLLEHPAHLWPQFQLAHIQWGSVDRAVRPFVERAYGGRRGLRFLPMGATWPAGGAAAERRGVIFAGAFEEPEGIMASWRRRFTTDIAELFHVMASHAVYTPGVSTVAAVEEVFAANDFPGGEELLRGFVPAACVEVDRVVANYRRLFLLRALDAAGIAVDLYGTGWREARFTHHRDHGAIPYDELLPRLREAAVVLDITTHLHDGPHERLLTAMAHGAVAAGALNPWIEERFEAGRDLIGYAWDALEQLPEAVAAVIESRARREAMADAGRDKVVAAPPEAAPVGRVTGRPGGARNAHPCRG